MRLENPLAKFLPVIMICNSLVIFLTTFSSVTCADDSQSETKFGTSQDFNILKQESYKHDAGEPRVFSPLGADTLAIMLGSGLPYPDLNWTGPKCGENG